MIVYQILILLFLSSCSSEDNKEKKIESLNTEISELNHQLTAYRIKEMNLEIESQPLMLEQWHSYAKALEHAEKEEQHIHQLENKIKSLKQQKNELQSKL
jgi:hypothetical protein